MVASLKNYLSLVEKSASPLSPVAQADAVHYVNFSSLPLQDIDPDYWVSKVIHELKTPLLGMSGLLEQLLLGIQDTEHRSMLLQLQQTSMDLKHLLDEGIPHIQRDTEVTRPIVDSSVFVVSDLLTEIQRLFSSECFRLKSQLYVDVAPEVPRYIEGTRPRLKQVLTNLVSNAIKHSPDGTVIVKASVKQTDSPSLEFRVIDNGCGFDMAQVASLFHPFQQYVSDSTRQDPRSGHGLGLFICARLVHAMQGRLAAYSAPKEGATFIVEIPLREAVPSSLTPLEETIQFTQGFLGNVLLIEDDPLTSYVLDKQLEEWAASHRIAASLAEADKLLASEPVDVILSDLHLGGPLSPLEWLPGLESPPIAIAFSASMSELVKVEALASGFAACFSKPVQPQLLQQVILKQGHRSLVGVATWNPQALIEALGYRSQLAREVTAIFLAEAPALIEALDSEQSVESQSFALHRLQGMADYLQAPSFSRACSRAWRYLTSQTVATQPYSEQLEDVKKHYTALHCHLTDFLGSSADD